MRIRDVEVLTLREGRMTTGRRNSPVSQLKCVGGSAGCSVFVPQVVQCYNRGWDGYDAQVRLFLVVFLRSTHYNIKCIVFCDIFHLWKLLLLSIIHLAFL